MLMDMLDEEGKGREAKHVVIIDNVQWIVNIKSGVFSNEWWVVNCELYRELWVMSNSYNGWRVMSGEL